MNKLVKIVLVAVALAGVVGSCYCIGRDNEKLKNEIYELLERDSLTEDEKDRVLFATDPDEMKESFVVLDEAHAKMFKEHFGLNLTSERDE